MRLSYTDLLNNFLDNTGNVGSTDATLTAFFQRNLGTRYQLVLAELGNYQVQSQLTTSTAASQQYYHNPSGFVNIEDVVITVGSLNYPLSPINSQQEWDNLNAVLIQSGAIPQYFFQRRDDFGIWPIPQATYTLTLNYLLRDRSLTNADYTTGTVSLTNGSATVTGSGTTFTAGMVGRWFQATTDGYWYRIASFTSTTVVTLENVYQGSTGSSLSYRIGETPEIPGEGHIILSDGVTSDWYFGVRKDSTFGNAWNNRFWTGAPNIQPPYPEDNIFGGLIGLKKRYAQRSNNRLIRRRPHRQLTGSKLWASSIS